MGSEASESEMKLLMAQMPTKQVVKQPRLYEEVNQTYEEDVKNDVYGKGFWQGFTAGAIVVALLYAVVGE